MDARYGEPRAALQDGDLEFPEAIGYAYDAVYNFFRKYGLGEDVDDWLIVNQAGSSDPDQARWASTLPARDRRRYRPYALKTSSTGVMRTASARMPSLRAPITLSSASSSAGFSPSYVMGENASATSALLQAFGVLRDDDHREVGRATGACGSRGSRRPASACASRSRMYAVYSPMPYHSESSA